MKTKYIIAIFMLTLFCSVAQAQNRIDALVDRYSSSTSSKFTSAVERNPKTRNIVKVVKVLELNYANILPFVEAFRYESKQGDYSERKDGSTLIMTLTMSGRTQNRIYMLKASDYYSGGSRNRITDCNITIIVKNKQ